MRVGYLQFAPGFGEVRRNIERVGELLSRDRADLWVLPELFSTGYQFATEHEVAELAEPVPEGPTTRGLIALAKEQGCHIVAGLAEMASGQPYNSAVLVGPSGLLALYRKIHLFYQEKRWFTPGDLPFPVAAIGEARIGLLVCYDHLFPEAARSLALQGAEVIAHPANLVMPGLAQLTMRVRAMENRVFTVTANRIGSESRTGETLRFTGLSQIVAPTGDVLVQAPSDREEVRALDIEPVEARNKHLTPLNDVFADRRPEFYRSLATGGNTATAEAAEPAERGEDEDLDRVTDLIIGAAIQVHRALGPGLLESAYETCLAFELAQRGLRLERQKGLPVVYREVRLDCGYRLDLVVDSKVIVEVKAVDRLTPLHRAQLLSYLKLSQCRLGLLINFNTKVLKDGIVRVVNEYPEPRRARRPRRPEGTS